MRLYKRNAMVIIRDLPKGCIRKAGQILDAFLATERETLRNWYNGMLMHILNGADYRCLLKIKRADLNFKSLKKRGMDSHSIVQLKQALLKLLEENAIQYSGAVFESLHKRYIVRLYRLPNELPLLSIWGDGQQQYLPN